MQDVRLDGTFSSVFRVKDGVVHEPNQTELFRTINVPPTGISTPEYPGQKYIIELHYWNSFYPGK